MRKKQVVSNLVSIYVGSRLFGDTVKTNHKISGCRSRDFIF